MRSTVKQQIEKHYETLFRRHGITEPEKQKSCLGYISKGYTAPAAMQLARSGGDHRELVRR